MDKPSKMIQSHLYTNKSETRLYAEGKENAPIHCILSSGNWLGVFERLDGWYRVLTIQGEGWVRAEDAEERSPFNLHAMWSPGEPIQYISAA